VVSDYIKFNPKDGGTLLIATKLGLLAV